MTLHVHVTWTPGEGGAKTDVAAPGAAGPLPSVWLQFWKGNPVDVLDLGPRGQPGEGYWPYTAVVPTLEAGEKLGGPEREIDAIEMTVTDTWTAVPKSEAELAAEKAPERAMIGALISAGLEERKSRETQRRLIRRVKNLEQS